ncbi:MAG TPA: tetratricopeptide repeat protein, partial [Candidatus Obscuribacter sp.]|nr:tetratricopeptide repeat protein [Candidatus Obscuribacter sp.]
MPSTDGPANLEQGRALCQQGLFLDAVPYFEAALSATERTFGESAPELAEYMQDLGDVYAAVERPADSLRVFDRLYRLGESILGSNHPQIVTVLWKMSILAERLGLVEDSFEMCNQALSRARLCLRPDEELAKAVVERYSYLSNLMREMDEMRRRGEDPLNLQQIENTLEAPRSYQTDLQEPPPAPFRQEERPYEGAVENLGNQYQNVERMPFSPSLNDALGSASVVNLESINRTKALDADLMAQNARAPQQGHLTGSSVF